METTNRAAAGDTCGRANVESHTDRGSTQATNREQSPPASVLVIMITALWITYSLFTETLLLTIHLWPVSGLLILNALAAVTLTHAPATPGRIITLMSSFMWPGLILAIAGSCWNVIGQPNSAIPTIGVTMVFGIQILLSIGIIYQLAGNRWVATSVSLIAVWFGLITWFLAGMTLTSVWL